MCKRSVFAITLAGLAVISISTVTYAQSAATPVQVNFDFHNGAQGWQADFADYTPANNKDDLFELRAGIRPLPPELNDSGTGFYIQGHNRSDDLFMFLKRRLGSADGIVAGQRYELRYTIVFASIAPSGCSGIGGSPGESVILKAGAAPIEPIPRFGSNGELSLNVNKGNQAQGGPAASVIGDIGNGRPCDGSASGYVSLERNHQHTTTVTAGGNGELWLLVGTDSGFEGRTALYYQRIIAQLTPTTVPPAPNPHDDAESFVTQHYLDFLNRSPDASGLAFWTNQITSCGSDQACIEVKRINVSAAFFLSIEFQQTGFFVHRLYRAAYGRLPRSAELLSDKREVEWGTNGAGRVIVGEGNWQEKLEVNKTAFVRAFAERATFTERHPATTPPEQYVDALNANIGNALTPSERSALIAGLQSGAETRATVLRKVAENNNFSQREFNPAFVLMQYFGYLRRNPDDAPDNDFSGYNFWLQKLNQFGGNFVEAEMVKAFLLAAEYRGRFGQE